MQQVYGAESGTDRDQRHTGRQAHESGKHFDNNFHLYLLVYVYLLGRKNFLFNVTKEKKIPFQCESSLSSHSLSSISACHQVNDLQSAQKEFFGNQRSHDALP
jgi:hypothetical protein